MKNFIYLIAVLLFFNGCELFYDCEGALDDIDDLSDELLAEATMPNCEAWKDKIIEYDDNNCGETDSEGASFNCEEYVCTMQELELLLFQFELIFSDGVDESVYCNAYDSTGIVMQHIVDAGGCSSYLTTGTITQSVVDDWVSNGCDYDDGSILNSSPSDDMIKSLKHNIMVLIARYPDYNFKAYKNKLKEIGIQ